MGKGRWLRVVILAVGSLGLAGSLSAAEVWPEHYMDGISRKLGRGVANVVTAPAELIRQPYLVGQQEGGLAAITYGLVKGCWWTLYRALAGLYDAATFYVPIPRGFRSLIYPEFVYAGGEWAP